MTIKKALLFFGYFLSACAVVAIFILHGVDGEAFRERFEAFIREKTGGVLTMKKLDLSLPFSATMEDMEALSPDGRNKIRLDALEIRPVFWKLLFFTPTMRLILRSNGGSLSVDVSPAFLFGKREIVIKAEKFPIDKAFVLIGDSKPSVGADITADIEVAYPRKSLADARIMADVTFEEIRLNSTSPSVSLFSGLAPKAAKCSLEVKERKLSSKHCSTSTPLGDAELRVTSKLLDDPWDSKLIGALVVRPKTKLAEAMSLLYIRSRKPDGAYYFNLSGSLNSPNLDI